MSIIFNEITPQDPYIVSFNESIELSHISYIIDLYQPIIGSKATIFYITLINHLSIGQIGISESRLHRHLMSQMNLSFPEIITARKMLEAIGLLKSVRYQHKETGEYIYEYSLSRPLNPVAFFQSDILSVLLLNRIGKTQFKILKERMTKNLSWNRGEYIKDEDITKAFDEVFDSILASELTVAPGSEEEALIQQPVDEEYVNKSNAKINLKRRYLDIEFIKGMLGNIYQVEKNFDREMIELLQELAFLYQLSEIEIINLLRDHTIYDDTGKIDKQLLRNRMREKFQYQKKEVVIVNKENKTFDKEPSNIKDKAQRHVWILENYSPIELMQQYQGGGKVPDADLRLIEGLLYDYQLPTGVVNVLIEYIMLSNDYKLPKNLTEKVAGHWKRLKITTVEEALSVAKKEHQLYKNWKENNKQTSKSNIKQSVNRKEKVPDYILLQEQKYHQKSDEKDINKIDQEKKAKIDQLLKDLGEV
ncbi:hypothetical protein BHF71_03545 [Vulcanibacillus modesticaldus]|uniref:Uncharacterized protein n=1 Tax=Vulcanibacillus modesticaldus TaxID=337097 RepID=A0A1D2YSX8_9BACI|nr:DnaD domain protein [Vulcanibacillus modesticaldus]OEF98102.1 hypothetical protein BHF71_03545 [Vulcanibacillus modesticaldus]